MCDNIMVIVQSSCHDCIWVVALADDGVRVLAPLFGTANPAAGRECVCMLA